MASVLVGFRFVQSEPSGSEQKKHPAGVSIRPWRERLLSLWFGQRRSQRALICKLLEPETGDLKLETYCPPPAPFAALPPMLSSSLSR